MKGFPWDEAMRFGFGTLRLSAAHFWGLTPKELAAAFEAVSGPARPQAPARSRLDELMERYPDGGRL